MNFAEETWYKSQSCCFPLILLHCIAFILKIKRGMLFPTVILENEYMKNEILEHCMLNVAV